MGRFDDYLHQAAEARAAHCENLLQGMKYVDLHTDALTKTEGVLQVTGEKLKAGGCLLECFAAFIEGEHNRFARALAYADDFDKMCTREGYNRVRSFADIQEDKINAMLTVEEGGAIEGSLEKLDALYARGVRMMTLLWNCPNEIGHPNFPDYEGLCLGHGDPRLRETARGLTLFGRECVARMHALGMIVDISHASDAVFYDVAEMSSGKGIPFVASHSGAAEICPWARNLTDRQIKELADCGGVVGLDFCADFLSEDQTPAGQRVAILAHAAHILKVGGEDVLALGSDFDGIPENAYMKDASHMPTLLDDFAAAFGERITEKIASGNALRVMKDALK